MSLLRKLHYKYLEEAAEGDAGNSAPVQTTPSPEDLGTTEVVDGGTELDFDGINDVLAFDPFAEGAETDSNSVESSESTEVAQPDGSEATPEPGKTETEVEAETDEDPTVAQVEESPELVLLRQQLDTQKQLIEQLQQGDATTPTEGENADETKPSTPAYEFTIPEQMMTLVDSEDAAERRQGIGALAQGVAQTVHAQVMEQVQGMFTQVVPQTVMSVVQQQNTAKAIFDDFYGQNPELNREELKPLVVQVAEAAFKESKAQEWSPALRDTIATRVKSILGQGKTTTPAKVPAKAPAGPSSGRQSRGNNASTPAAAQADDVASLLF